MSCGGQTEHPLSSSYASQADCDASSGDEQTILQADDSGNVEILGTPHEVEQQSNPAKDGNARDQIFRNMPVSPTAQAQNEGRSSSSLPNLISSRPKITEPLPPNKDSDCLLNFMRQSRSGQTNSNDVRPNSSIPPELLPTKGTL
ncbi:MAG: hypothetical protein Q9220_006174, partial [cf. Caloplaca sp. 1 TL-2023]